MPRWWPWSRSSGASSESRSEREIAAKGNSFCRRKRLRLMQPGIAPRTAHRVAERDATDALTPAACPTAYQPSAAAVRPRLAPPMGGPSLGDHGALLAARQHTAALRQRPARTRAAGYWAGDVAGQRGADSPLLAASHLPSRVTDGEREPAEQLIRRSAKGIDQTHQRRQANHPDSRSMRDTSVASNPHSRASWAWDQPRSMRARRRFRPKLSIRAWSRNT